MRARRITPTIAAAIAMSMAYRGKVLTAATLARASGLSVSGARRLLTRIHGAKYLSKIGLDATGRRPAVIYGVGGDEESDE